MIASKARGITDTLFRDGTITPFGFNVDRCLALHRDATGAIIVVGILVLGLPMVSTPLPVPLGATPDVSEARAVPGVQRDRVHPHARVAILECGSG